MNEHYSHKHPASMTNVTPAESLRFESVTVSVGFDDMLNVTLPLNKPHFDTQIVVTNHADWKTHAVANRHGAILVITDLFTKNGRSFNKGAAINAGFDHFQWFGWRAHIDADTILPSDARHVLFNRTALDENCIYGAERTNVQGKDEINALLDRTNPRHAEVSAHQHRPVYPIWLDPIRGYCPIGYFQMWHAGRQKIYPYSRGNAAHDDLMFSAQWPRGDRRMLPTVKCHHLVTKAPQIGENWDGNRAQPRLDGKPLR